MATFYAKERAKYGNLTGQIIIWLLHMKETQHRVRMLLIYLLDI